MPLLKMIRDAEALRDEMRQRQTAAKEDHFARTSYKMHKKFADALDLLIQSWQKASVSIPEAAAVLELTPKHVGDLRRAGELETADGDGGRARVTLTSVCARGGRKRRRRGQPGTWDCRRPADEESPSPEEQLAYLEVYRLRVADEAREGDA